MKGTRLLATVLLLVVNACGDDDAGTIESTTATTAGTETTSTTPSDAGSLARLLSAPVEDPLLDTGFHTMQAPDSSLSMVVSADPLVGSVPDGNLLGLGTMDPYPVMTGVTPEMLVVVAWVQNPQADVLPDPSAVVLYGLGGEGWEVLASISDTIVLRFLETTTDYAAWKPAEGIPYARTTVKSLDWTGFAHFVADVVVLDYPDNGSEFRAEIECSLSDPGGCILLSDDGVFRPGDDGEAVEAFENDLMSIGYAAGDVDGLYDGNTEAAVARFQRDYRLTVDGKAGPQTLALVAEIVAGLSNIVMASQDGIGAVPFTTIPEVALPQLISVLGAPDYTVGWQVGPCGTGEWYKVTWGGFTAIFTDFGGFRQFDGWEVTDLSNVPSNLYFVGGIHSSWTWSDFAAMGAEFDSGYGWWNHAALGYGLGLFVYPPSNPPAADATILGFGSGTGAVLYDC